MEQARITVDFNNITTDLKVYEYKDFFYLFHHYMKKLYPKKV